MTTVPIEGSLGPHAWTAAETVSQLEGDLHGGLMSEEAERRLIRYGHNALHRAPGAPVWFRFLLQFRNVQVYLLFAAMAVSLLVWAMEHAEGLPYEAMTIAAILLLNALFGFRQEERAGSRPGRAAADDSRRGFGHPRRAGAAHPGTVTGPGGFAGAT